MKKFIVAFLGLFMMLGASILYACGPSNIELSLSTQSVSLQLNGEEADKSTTVITDVTGTDDKSLTLDFVYDDDVASATLSQNSEGQNVITITALNEGNTELVVTTNQGSVRQTINIEVYTEVTSMTEKTEEIEEGQKSSRFLVKNGTYQLLDAQQLISFTPSTSTRKNVVWTFEANGTTEYDGASISGNQIFVPDTFASNEIVLRATSANNSDVYTTVTITCIDQIDVSNIRIGASAYETSGFDFTTSSDGTALGEVSVEITPNISQYVDSDTDRPLEDVAYIKVETQLSDGLELIPTITDTNGNATDLLQVVSHSSTASGYIYRVFASNTSVNQNFYVSFRVGYSGYDYSVDIASAFADIGEEYSRIIVEAAEKIEKVSVYRNGADATLNNQTLYSQYSSSLNSGYGQLFSVSLTPDTVLWGEDEEPATGRYTITLPAVGDGTVNPIQAFYRLNGVYMPISFTLQDGQWVSEEISSTSSKTFEHSLYLRANSEYFTTNDVTIANNIPLTFASVDNSRATKAEVLVNIIQTADEISITGETGEAVSEIILNSTTAVSTPFYFILHGQTTVDGLSISSNSQYVDISDPIFVSVNNGENVRFAVNVTLKEEYIGLTNSATAFTIVHENGMQSDPITLNIYFPLTNASVTANNTSASIVLNDSRNYIVENGVVNLNGSSSAGVLMLKNGTTTPLVHSFNTSTNGNMAQASVSVDFYDFVEGEITLEEYLSLFANNDGDLAENLNTIIERAEAQNTTSAIVTFDSFANNAIRTTDVGYTYIVFTYEGIGLGGGTATFKRIVLVHSYDAVESFAITPASDRSFSLYASDSVGDTGDATQKTIKVSYSSNDITYKDSDNFVFRTVFFDGENYINYTGNFDATSRQVVWSGYKAGQSPIDEYYQILNVNPQATYIEFTIYAFSTNGAQNSPQTLYLDYVLTSTDASLNQAGLDGSTSPYEAVLSFTIINADRVEEVTIDGIDDDGIYFELGSLTSTSQYVIVETAPSSARNTGVSYIVVNENGDQTTSIVNVSPIASVSTRLRIDLADGITEGTSGTLYVFPTDAVNNGIINYQYTKYIDEQEQTKSGKISLSDLGRTGSDGLTNFEYLTQNAFFTNNEGKKISFANIFKEVSIEVADGRSFEHAYRVYDESGFDKGDSSSTYFYSVMNDITLSKTTSLFEDFTGGVEGYNGNSDITITLTGYNFAGTLSRSGSEGGQIRNISFNGQVTGAGFVVGTNNGTISNVTIDTDGTYSSVLSYQNASNDTYVGGIAGTNGANGTITNVSVLGLTISASSATVGGVAGQNSGSISIARVEFYNLEKRATAETESANATLETEYNTFTGATVGGVIGAQTTAGTISQVYVYDYNLSSEDSLSRLKGAAGALVGSYTGGGTLTFSESFALVDNISSLEGFVGSSTDNQNQTLSFTRSYIAYYNESDTYTVVYSNATGENSYGDFNTNNERVITSSDSNFNANINGGKPYLRYFYQDEKITSVSGQFSTVLNGDLYSAIPATTDDGQSIVFFRNNVNVGSSSLTSSQAQDYRELNTIAISSLLANYNDNMIISSDSSSLVISGSEIFIQSIGSGNLSIYSKQDVSINATSAYVVDKALSRVIVTSENATGRVEEFTHDQTTTVNLQKSKSRLFVAQFATTSVYLGSGADKFALDMLSSFDITTDPSTSSVTFEPISNTSFNAISNGDTALTGSIYPVLSSGAEALQSAVTGETKVDIIIKPVDGAIAIGYDGDEISMSPSTIANVNVSMQTTAENDTVAPQIALVANGVETALSMKLSGNTFTFSKQDGTAVFTVTRTDNSPSQSDPTTIYTKEFAFRFEVEESYKSVLSQDEVYKVSFVSASQFTSESLTINLARQGISKADVTNYKVDTASYNSGITTYTTLSTSTGVMAPGSSSILHASVNPAYAYYDYMEVTVTGAPIANAVVFIPVEPTSNNLQYQTTSVVTFESLPNGFRFTPASYASTVYNGENPKYDLYFHATFSRAIPEDCTLTITATYYVYNSETGEPKVVDYVNSFIFVSYLAEPTISIDGDTSTLLAKGGSAEVEIAVNLDQEVEAINISGARQGVEYTFLGEEIDQTNNRRIYRYNLSATILAESMTEDNRVYVNATVVRRINNNVERKTATATVTLVDFKINPDATNVEGAENGTLNVYANINQTISLNYVFDPEDPYYDNSNQAAIDAYNEIMRRRTEFEQAHSYPVLNNGQIADGYTSDYLINVQETVNNDQTTTYTEIPLIDRIYYVVGNNLIPVSGADSESSLFDITVDNRGNINIRAKTLTEATQQMMIRTYVVTNGESRTIETYFNVQVRPWTSLDLPNMITTAQEFLSLAESEGSGMYDYILMNDIVLEDYVPFNTDFIASLDGNGHTIHIKSFDTTASSSTLNLALFDTVNENTTLKNVRVNLYNGGQMNVNVGSGGVSDLNVAGFAITNNGIITNCEVVAFYTDQYAIGQSGLNEPATTQISGNHGININYMNGSNQVSMSENSSWDSQVAGFVINNNGNITNSRVGGDDIVELLEVDPTYNNQITARVTTLENFTITAQGQTAGFVLQNQGSISASFVKNLAMQNDSRTAREDKAYATGFVGTNSGKILTSYVEGVKQTTTDNSRIYARLGSQISTEQAVIAGFVLTNSGDSSLIENSYSNIMISNADTQNGVYLASGFVYRNEGRVANCYSASQIENQRYSQMNFSGLDSAGNLLASGEYENCYYYNMEYNSTDANTGSSTEDDFDTNVIMVPSPDREEYFYGFSIATYGGEDGIWAMDTNSAGGEGLKLLEPDDIAISYRYVNYLEYNADGSVNTDGEYQLPYGIIYVSDGTSEYEIDASYGKDSNPIIVRTAQEFIDITGASESTPIQEMFKDTIHGTYRLVSDIDMSAFSSQIMSLPSTQSAFSGKFYGNGFTISGLSLSYNGNNLAYGLFKSIEPYTTATTTYYPRIVGLNIQTSSNMLASDTTFVGTLAGYIKDAMIVNVEITYSNGAMVQGRNFVGSLAGLISGDSIVKNITVENPNVQAVRRTTTGDETTFEVSDINYFRNAVLSALNYTYMFTGSDTIASITSPYSYAGGVAGYVDVYSSSQSYFSYTTSPEFNVTVIRALGTINVTGQVAGGLFGLTAHQTFIEDAGVTVTGKMEDNTSHILSTKDYAGGVIGQSFGYLSKLFSTHEEEVQQDIEDGIASYYTGNTSVERGILNLFMAENQSSTNYSQKAIGGLVGFVGSGLLQTSYSKLNVISLSAESAGGLIGEIKLTGARSYHYEATAGEGYTKFLFLETYATGDVRAYTAEQEGNSGGLVGFIADSSDRIALLATNAINFFTNIDYRTGEAYSNSQFATEGPVSGVANDTGNIANFVYQLVGGAAEDVDIPTAVTIAPASNVGTGTEGETKSLGFVQYYTFDNNATQIYINFYKDYHQYSVYASDLTQPVEPIYTYTNGSAGYQATQKVFLNSMVWDTNNWIHNSDRIFPEIKYSIGQLTTVYLDDWNKANVLQMMTENNNLNVIVRGEKAEGSGVYVDVDISSLQGTYTLSGFSGTISGLTDSQYYTDTSGITGETKARQVRLIISSSLFEATSAGFTMDNVHIQVGGGDADRGNNDPIAVEGGIISQGSMETATLNNITLFINKPISVNSRIIGGNQFAAGLIAPSIDGTSIESLTFDLTGLSNLSKDTTIMSVDATKVTEESELYVGWIAGYAEQTSNTTPMNIYNVRINATEKASFTAISFPNVENSATAKATAKSANIGLFFGAISKDSSNQQNTIIRVAECNISFIVPNDLSIDINASNLVITDSSDSSVNLGGFVGNVEGLNSLTLLADTKVTSTLNLTAPAPGDTGTLGATLNIGGMFGLVGGSSTLISTEQSGGENETPKITLEVSISETGNKHNNGTGDEHNNVYLGGMAGRSSRALPIKDMTIDLTINAMQAAETYIGGAVGSLATSDAMTITGLTSTVTVIGGTDANKPVSIGSAHIGGVIGQAGAGVGESGGAAGFTIGTTGNRKINSTLIIVGHIKSTNTHVGGVIGQTNQEVSIYGTEAKLSIANTFVPTGNSSQNSGGEGSVNIGGLVGFANQRVTLANIYVRDESYTAGEGAVTTKGLNLTTSASTPVAIGSLIGYSTHVISASGGNLYSDLTINSTSTTAEISGAATAETSGAADLYIGGLVGYNSLADTYANENIDTVLANTAYIGTITVDLGDARGASVGGIMGFLQGDADSAPSITNSLFGGKIIIKEQSQQDVIVGGTIANANSNFKIDKANNYGDVFIDYSGDDNASSRMSSYKFGGIVGQINFEQTGVDSEDGLGTITESNSMVTNHNARLAGTNADTTKDQTGAIVGAGTLTTTSSNYYNSAVSLAYDNQGTDIGYSDVSEAGYTENTNSPRSNLGDNNTIISRIKDAIDDNLLIFIGNGDKNYSIDSYATLGTKLNPAKTWTAEPNTTDADTKNDVGNGSDYDVKYFTSAALSSVENKELINVAIVGNFDLNATLSKPIQSISGYSSLSGINFEISYNNDTWASGDKPAQYIGGLVNQMSGNAIIYGVGVNGSMSIGGNSTTSVGGIVGNMTSGLIAESYTSLDMIYRAASGGTISAITNHTGSNLAFIEYTYATGSVVSYISANLYAFNSGDSNLKISNSYTITKLDNNNYTGESYSGTLGVRGNATYDNFYFDYNAVNNKGNKDNEGKYNIEESTDGQSTSKFLDGSLLEDDNFWTNNINYNYGYPTRGFTYLKQSSWASSSGAANGNSGYDSYVTTYEYTRAGNGSDPDNTETTYLVPNIGVLAYLLTGDNGNAITNMALMYDVDLSATQFASSWSSLSFGSKNLDGQDHTITGLKDSLFKSITGGVVRNLRLTEANSSSALLAKTMQNETNTDGTSKTAIVSNITLEGEITNSTSDLGGLINTVSGGEINTVTSMLKITQNATGSSEYSLGGLIGHIDEANQSGVKIYYCSNYGPITGESKGRAVGGLVGSTSAGRNGSNGSNGNITIDHCFNGSSVLAGYTSGTDYDEQPYYAGGIIGTIHGGNNISIQITNCYNAGIIKAGNKTHTKMSYAAGIVAHSDLVATTKPTETGVYINNCYNEGSIEALGIDPTTEYVVTGVDYDADGLVTQVGDGTEGNPAPKIYLVQTNDKNVSGYHIADIAVTNCKSDGDLELDGAILEKYSGSNVVIESPAPADATVYGSGEYLLMYDKETTDGYVSVNSDEPGQQIYGSGLNVGNGASFVSGGEWKVSALGMHTYHISKKFLSHYLEIKLKSKKANDFQTSETPLPSNFSILQSNKLGIGEIFVETQFIDVEIKVGTYRSGTNFGGYFEDQKSGTTISQTINRNYYYDFAQPGDGKKSITDTITEKEEALDSADNENYEALSLNKSAFGPSNSVDYNQTVSINGSNYTLAYNYGSAFESSTYSYTWTTIIDNIGITKDSAIDSSAWGYSVTATGTNGQKVEAASTNNNPSITMQVSGSGSGRTFTFSYRGESLGTNPTLSGTINYSKKVSLTLNTATSDFIYIDDGSFAIDLRDNYSIALGTGGTSTNINYLANFVTSGATLSYNNNPGCQNVLELESGGQTYYFVLDTENERLIYYTDAKVTGVDGVIDDGKVNRKGDSETLLNVVERIPTSFDKQSKKISLSISATAINSDASFAGEIVDEQSTVVQNTWGAGMEIDVSEITFDEIIAGEPVNGITLYSMPMTIPSTYSEIYVFAESIFVNRAFFAISGNGTDMRKTEVNPDYQFSDNMQADALQFGIMNNMSKNSYVVMSTSELMLAMIKSATWYGATQRQANNGTVTIAGNSLRYNPDFTFQETPVETDGDWTANYTTTIDNSGKIISYDSLIARSGAYFRTSSFNFSAKAVHSLSSIENTTDHNVIYTLGTNEELYISEAGSTINPNGQDIKIYQTYNGTTDRPIKTGDEITFTYDRSKITVDGTTTETYKTATFNVVQEENGKFSLEWKEGFSFSGSYTTEGEEGPNTDSIPLNDEEIKAISAALTVYENNGVLYIYSNDENINIDSVDRKTNVTDTLTISGIERGKSTASLQLSGINIINENNNLFSREGTILSTYFNNIDDDFALTEQWRSGDVDIDLTNYTEPSGSVKAIILMNDIFAPAKNFAIGFNIFGNGHAIISSSTSNNLFGTIGDTENEITIKDLAFVGATTKAIATSVDTSAKLSNIDFYGTVYNNINDNTLGLDGISGTNINIYTAIYGKNGVNSKAAATYRGVVFAADGQDGLTTVNATAGQSIALTNATNNLIAIKAGDGGNGAVTLSSGSPVASDIKPGGAAGTSSVSETFASTSGISGGVYRDDETDNDIDDFKARALGAVYTSTDKNGNHILLGFDENGNRTATVTGDLGLDNASIIIRSPDSTLYNLSGAKSNFAVFYEGGGDDSPYAAGLLSSGGRGDFVYAADGEHLGQDAFKYLVLDANDNSVYSKSSFIAAGASTLENLRMNKSDIENLFANEMISTIKITSLYYGSSSSVLRYEINENNQTIGNSLSDLSEWYKSINENKTFMVHTEVSENPNISGEEWITGLQGYKNDTVILSALGWALGMTTMEEVQAWIDNDFVFDIDKVTFIVEITFK